MHEPTCRHVHACVVGGGGAECEVCPLEVHLQLAATWAHPPTRCSNQNSHTHTHTHRRGLTFTQQLSAEPQRQ